ncbi:hypothetical protein SEA_NHAGOS_13 [Gordonia phage NHagos]|nr:hypothetical protein SEA_NHAGOS_13 [Gordonia phage NHagos]
MPEGVITEVDEGFAIIDFVDRSLRGPGLAKLIEVGGPETVEALTRRGPRKVYRVPEGNAREAGLLDEPGVIATGDTGSADLLSGAASTGPGPESSSTATWSTGRDPVTPAEIADYPDGEPDDTWKFDQLKAYAGDHGVDIDGLRSKADVLAAINGDETE